MKQSNFLDKLLNGASVEWKALGDLNFFEIANSGRKPIKASLRVSGKTPYYGANNIQDYVSGHTHDGEFVLIAEDGSASIKNYSIQYVTGKFWANNHVHVIRGSEKVNIRFIYHYLCIINFIPFLTGGNRAKLTKGQLVEIQIPIPPLAVQTEIVRILDKFTDLITELNKELSLRKKQYNYYRDKLLTFKDGAVEWKTLGEVMKKITDGSHNPAKASLNGKFPMISAKNINNGQIDFDDARMLSIEDFEQENKRTRAKVGDVLMTIVGTIGRISVIKEFKPMVFQRSVCVMSPNHEILDSNFIKYTLETNRMQNELTKQANGSAQKGLYLNQIAKLQIPIPPLAEQARIVAILDKFDTLTNSITEGLPREIELRQKQYEYYRDLLLNFKKPLALKLNDE